MRYKKSEAYSAGYEAGSKAAEPNNPYDFDTQEQEYLEWEEGYMAGYPAYLKYNTPTK